MTNEKRLWQQVVLLAFKDALQDDVPIRCKKTKRVLRYEPSFEKSKAVSWVLGRSKDFSDVCTMAGMDPSFLYDAFVSGKINRDLLSSASVE